MLGSLNSYISSLGDFSQALVLRQATEWWKSADWVPENAADRTELGDDVRKYDESLIVRCPKEVAEVRERINNTR